MRLILLPERFAICKLPPETPLPAWAGEGAFFSVTRTPTELSVVTAEANVPDDVHADSGWRLLSVAGTLNLELTGILLQLAEPLARAGVNLFALSTFDTDHLLVPESKLAEAITALENARHEVAA